MPCPAGDVTPLACARSLRSKRKRVQGACTLSLPNFRMSWLTSPPPSLRIFFPNLEHDPGGGTAPCSRGGRNRARGRISGGAPSCPGQLPKGVLMDAQTVIAVCELLLVVVALIDLVGRRDE